VGDVLKFKVVSIDRERERIGLQNITTPSSLNGGGDGEGADIA
jgi:hypothetical protein